MTVPYSFFFGKSHASSSDKSRISTGCSFVYAESSPPVSYTHLDVYKRQRQVECYGIEDTIKHWNEDQFGAGKVLLLLPDLKSMKQVYDGGVTVPQIQVGGLGGAPNRKVVFQNITLDDPDVETLEYLKGKGADIIDVYKRQVLPLETMAKSFNPRSMPIPSFE